MIHTYVPIPIVVTMPQKKYIYPKESSLQQLVSLVSAQINIFVTCVQTHIFYKGAYRPVHLIIGRQWYNTKWNIWMTFYIEFEDTFTPYTQQLSRLMNIAMEQHGSIKIKNNKFDWGGVGHAAINNVIIITIAPDNDGSQLRYWNSKRPDITYGADGRMLRGHMQDDRFTPKIIGRIQEIIESSVVAFAVEFSPSDHLIATYTGIYKGI